MRAPSSVETVVAQRLGRLSPRVQRRLSRRPPIVIDGQRLEPDVQLMLALREYLGEPVWDETLTVEQARRLTREEAFLARGTRTVPVGAVRGRSPSTACPPGSTAPPSPARSRCCSTCTAAASWSATSTPTTRRAACSAATRASTCSRSSTARRRRRRSPATSRTRAPRSDGPAERYEHVAVAGDSAGGNLAATIAIEFDPELALLIYPVVDATQERESRRLFGKGFFLTDELMTWYTGHFMPEGSDPTDPRSSPILHPDLKDSAPALIVTAGFDPLRDEGEAYAAKLRELGVKTVQRRFPGLFHGFINSTGASPSSRDALVEVAGMTRALLRSR